MKPYILSCLLVSILLGIPWAEAQADSIHPRVTFDQSVHFISTEGEPLVLPSGTYLVEKEDAESLRMIADPEMDSVLVQAKAITHEEPIQHPTVLSVREGEDGHHLVLLLPEGQGVEAVGSYSGITSRGRIPRRLSPARLRQRLDSGRQQQPPRGIPIPRRFRGNQGSPNNSSSSLRDGMLSRAKVLELERKRDRVMKDIQGQPGWQKLLKDVVENEKRRLNAENRLIANLEKRLKNARIPTFPDVCKTPKVKTKSVTLPIEPHERIILNGCGFGDQKGEVHLESQVFPGGRIALEIHGWTRKAIVAKVPELKGVKHSRLARLRVIKKDLTLGEPIPTPFKATVSCELIPRSRIRVNCAEKGACNFGPEWSFGAKHGKAKPFNGGVDVATGSIGGGWRLQGMDYRGGGIWSTVGVPTGFKMKATKFRIKMPWVSWDGHSAKYGVKLLACGPWGVPF